MLKRIITIIIIIHAVVRDLFEITYLFFQVNKTIFVDGPKTDRHLQLKMLNANALRLFKAPAFWTQNKLKNQLNQLHFLDSVMHFSSPQLKDCMLIISNCTLVVICHCISQRPPKGSSMWQQHMHLSSDTEI